MGSSLPQQENDNKKNIRITPHPISEKVFLENIKKRGLKISEDFSIDNFRNKAISLYNDSMKLKDKQKYQMLKSAIFFDNNNEKIMEEYLKIEKMLNKEEYDKNILIYKYHISPKTYFNITGENKKSSKDLLLEVFDILKNYKIETELTKELEEKEKINNYFYKIKNKKLSITENLIFSIDTNLELSLYEAYIILFSEINKKIGNLWKIINDKTLTFESKLKNICPDKEYDRIKQLRDEYKVNEGIAILFRTRFFKKILVYIKDYVTELESVIKKCLELKDIKRDFYMLLFIIVEIKMIITHEKKPIYTDKIKNYITESINNDELNTIISKYPIDIKNLDKYYIKDILDEIKKNENLELNKLMLYKFIKLEYFNDNNIIQDHINFIRKFNEKISKSKTILDALYQLYPIFKSNKLFESEFILNLFQNALKKCYFFPFRGKKGAISLRKSGTLLFFIPNKTNIDEINLDVDLDRKIYLIGNLGVFIYIEFHEVLGYFLRVILSYILDYNFLSPRGPETGCNESGECIEYILFGKRVPNFSVKQLLYLLDFNNYNKSLNTFRKEFNEINNSPINPSKEFVEMLKEIGITLEINLINNNGEVAELFKENYISGDYLIEGPNLFNCNENYELFYDEDFENITDDMFKSN